MTARNCPIQAAICRDDECADRCELLPASERPGGWVPGIGWVAWMLELADGDEWFLIVGEKGAVMSESVRTNWPNRPAIVTRWADGSTPAPLNPDTASRPLLDVIADFAAANALTAALAATPAPVTPPTEDCPDCRNEMYPTGPDGQMTCGACGGAALTPPETVPVPRAEWEALVEAAAWLRESMHASTNIIPTGDQYQARAALSVAAFGLAAAAGVSDE